MMIPAAQVIRSLALIAPDIVYQHVPNKVMGGAATISGCWPHHFLMRLG
jgi:hypothetical protein